MLPRAQMPDSHSRSSPQHTLLYRPPQDRSLLSDSQPIPHHPHRPQMGLENTPVYHSHSCVPSSDPSAADFRAFYPYTPNEVKHRKRTTSTQLKRLEGIFKRDTKPNANLRNELALQLDMTARGVQVWFQNRRAKEKIKAGKAASAGKATSGPRTDRSATSPDESPSPSPADDTELGPESPTDCHSQYHHDHLETGDASSQDSPIGASPPQLHLITDPTHTSWHAPLTDSSEEPSFARQSSGFPNHSIAAARRGSLPVNALPHFDNGSHGPPHVDPLDPLARRRSVDASLHRLASNPYAPLARAKNGAIFGPRFAGPQYGRHQPGRSSYAAHSRPSLPHNSMPYRLDIRHSSVDSRALRFSQNGTVSPSPSPLSPYHAVRASLPDHHMYAMTSRTVPSPIPGPLPSPDFSFGVANTPSMTSPSSVDSERNSPDSLRSFTFRGDDVDTEDDGTSASYDAFSRFGSIVSIATSDSSAYYSEISGCADHELGPDANSMGRRDSCSGQFLGLMSNLDVNGCPAQPAMTEIHISPLSQHSYAPHESLDPSGNDEDNSHEPISYASPTSTISPGGSPHIPGVSPINVPISRSSELAFALQGKPDETQGVAQDGQYPHPPPAEASTPSQDNPTYFYSQEYVQDSNTLQQPSNPTDNSPPEEIPREFSTSKYPFDFSSPLSSQGHYNSAYTSMADGYTPVDERGEFGIHHRVEYGRCAPITGVYNSYGDNIDPSVVSVENSVQNIDSYVAYTS
ncbi:hypothetical protein BD779DRAFT_969147 [Infundibulicybe gibba]|nr:hypothetical protein BD779DRAFT_969147 [Infundibulicybe gibba]